MRLKGSAVTTYLSADKILESSSVPPAIEYIHSLTPSGIPQHELKLQIGSPIICLRNINPHQGLVNGTKLIVINTQQHVIFARIVSSFKTGSIVHIPRIIFDVDDEGTPFKLRRVQFPVRLCYAMTINKSQGQTITGRLGIYLPKQCFSHGQLNVATSRVTLGNNLFILSPIAPDNTLHNIIFPELI